MDTSIPSEDWITWILHRYDNLRKEGIPSRQSWDTLKEEFLQAYRNAKPQGNPDQAWKNFSGTAFEKIVRKEVEVQIAQHLDPTRIMIYHWNDLKRGDIWDIIRQMLSDIVWIRGTLQKPYLVESQVDFIVLELHEAVPKRIIAAYSVKVSLRERFQQDLYWAEKFRSRGIPLCFITLDNDGVLTRALSQGKLTSKQAQMAAALYDRTYLFVDEPLEGKGLPFRPISSLYVDLKLWWNGQ